MVKSCYVIAPVAITLLLMMMTITTNPSSVFATLGPFANFNINDTSNSTAETSSKEIQTINGFSLYQSDLFGFIIQYPSDWRVDERNYQTYLDTSNQNPVIFDNDIVNFLSSNRSETGTVEALIGISYLPIGKYLDTNDLKVKSKTAHDYIVDSINYMTSYDPSKFIQYKVIRDKLTTIGTNHYPAWRLEYTSTALGSTSYAIDIFSIIGDKVFKFSTGADPLKIPSYLPIFQKMIDSFQITG